MTCLSALGYWRYLLGLTLSLHRCLGRSGWPAQSSAGLVVSHHLTIFLLMKTLISTLEGTRVHRPTNVVPGVGGRGRSWNLPRGFGMLEYSETILPSVESLRSSLQDKLSFMSGGAAGDLWRHQQWSPSWISLWFRNQGETMRNGDFFAWHEK